MNKYLYITSSIIVTFCLTACGGGSSGNNASDDTDTPADTGSPPDTGGGNTTSRRVQSISYDFDDNGTAEGSVTFTYDNQGRIEQADYRYTDDGTPDSNMPFGLGKGTQTHLFTYDSDDPNKTATWEITFANDAPVGFRNRRFVNEWVWNDALVTAFNEEQYTDTGGLFLSAQTIPSYLEEQLTGWTKATTINNTVTTQRASFTYDENDLPSRVSVVDDVVNSPELSRRRVYSWLPQTNELDNFVEYRDEETSQGSTLVGLRFRLVLIYDDNQRLGAIEIRPPGATPIRSDYARNSAGEIVSERFVDNNRSGTATYTWESGTCQPTVSWIAESFPLYADPPYTPAAGYIQTSYCAD